MLFFFRCSVLFVCCCLLFEGVGKASIVAFRSGVVMGFLLAANDLLVLYIAINLFMLYYSDDWEGLFEAVTGYGLGRSSMALFGRVGGGIYAKAANVGVDLMGKVEMNIPKDDLRNLVVIANNVGDKVGDITGMGSYFFGSMMSHPILLLLLLPSHHLVSIMISLLCVIPCLSVPWVFLFV